MKNQSCFTKWPGVILLSFLFIFIPYSSFSTEKPELSIVTDNSPGISVRHGLTKLTDALVRKNITYERVCSEAESINLMIARKSNAKQPHEPWQNFLISDSIKRIETTFSQISSMLLERVHAVTVDAFLMKVIPFIFVFTINEKFI